MSGRIDEYSLLLGEGRIIECSDELPFLAKEPQKPLVVDVEPQRLRGRIKVGTVDEERDPFGGVKMH